MTCSRPHLPYCLRLLCLVLAFALLLPGDPGGLFAATRASDQQTKSSHAPKRKAAEARQSTEQKAPKPRAQKAQKHKEPRKARSAKRKAAVSAQEGMHLNVKAAYLMNMSNGKVYYAQDADDQIPPASVTKVLTLYLVREAMAQGRISPNTPIPVSALAIRTGGSTMSLYKGEKVPLSEIIKGISVVSANNACVAVAEYLGKGDSRRFVAQMNATARRLGMRRSVFRNPNGLPATGQVSTAADIARLSAAYLARFPDSLAIHSMTTHTYHGVTHRNANSLLGRYDGVDGLKTGFVCASGYNITATAKRGNTRLIAVVLGARNPIVREVETARLLEYGFEKAAAEAPAPAKPQRKKK
uniref:D-alanyl-D-alanine carboxypeptidase n=1 Tax=Fundidesulfovibrio putealis TaxID=270496 RepID=A0A7C4AGU1_9BACT